MNTYKIGQTVKYLTISNKTRTVRITGFEENETIFIGEWLEAPADDDLGGEVWGYVSDIISTELQPRKDETEMTSKQTTLQTIPTVNEVITKTMTPDVWFEFQKQDAVVEVIEIEATADSAPGYREYRYTFVWDASKAS